jgi:hypothetical protein
MFAARNRCGYQMRGEQCEEVVKEPQHKEPLIQNTVEPGTSATKHWEAERRTQQVRTVLSYTTKGQHCGGTQGKRRKEEKWRVQCVVPRCVCGQQKCACARTITVKTARVQKTRNESVPKASQQQTNAVCRDSLHRGEEAQMPHAIAIVTNNRQNRRKRIED